MNNTNKLDEQTKKRHEYDNQRYENVFKIVILLKIMYIGLALISILSKLSSTEFVIKDNILIITIMGTIISIMMNYYLSWSLNYTKDRVYDKFTKKDYFESIVLMVIFILSILITDMLYSDYKILSILAVLIGAIQFGQRYSIGLAICYSTIIIGIDLISNATMGKGSIFYFEKDLVLTAILFIIAGVVGMYVDIEKKYFKELKTVANMDELTEIYNHRYFQDSLTSLINKANIENQEVSLLFMDIDYFKYYNDTHGHQAGDVLLMEVASLLNQSTRHGDIVARYGGEEFAVILPNTNPSQAIKIGERIRNSIEKTYFKGQETQPNKNLTMSIGVSTYPTIANSKFDLIKTADYALYKAKAFNRNRVELYKVILDDLYKSNIDKEILDNITRFIIMINQKDKYTYGHVERVVDACKQFGDYLGLSNKEKIDLQIGAYIHDIGKFNLSKDILNKRDNLNNDEFEIFKNHCINGEYFINNIECLRPYIPMVKYHHERYDGRGYPEGIKGKEIPYLARIISIVDGFDSIISKHQYISKKIVKEAIENLKRNSGTAYDPELVKLFIEMVEKNLRVK